MHEIEIFKAGKRTDAHGVMFDITVDDLQQVVSSYDPAFHEAPAVIGHPAMNAPAYAWVQSVRVDGDTLKATLTQIDPEFGELVKHGRYKKVSASFYTPDSPSNPKKGSWSLRHVGFLGAVPPAVKGLKEPVFNETSTDGIADFAAQSEEIDKPVVRLEGLPNTPNQTATVVKSDLSDDEQAELQRLRQENLELKRTTAQEKYDRQKADNASFAESLIACGKLAPIAKEQALALLNGALAMQSGHAEFGEAVDLLVLSKEFLQAQPSVAVFGEVAKAQTAPVGEFVQYAETDDPDRIELDKKVRAYIKQHSVDYATAIKAVLAS